MEFQYLYGRLMFSPRALVSAQNLWRKQSLKTSESASLACPTLPISPVLGFDRYCKYEIGSSFAGPDHV